ncbi:heavy-metal-associated domain-containing protein [filamentous cyanobacterium LEGE 11480]|uniref:Heavy-metal-associated domain-containing protein n=1 Tax=Romeriopsis navalis LEGE 11480 TaxID=2777977 RepID=A0A928VS36_9CYAN|nr:heavy-metal-associated domain-containing protein [Romeriopsis navalis]MBE9031540.1 heavy-metal-associated domain-containing protein [Romeriopsis navalis LEGE 11480]
MTLQFTVPDMACGACASTIEQAVKAIDPGAEFEADTTRKIVKISTMTPAAQMQQAIQKAGYNPQ